MMLRAIIHRPWALVGILLLTGCASFKPVPLAELDYLQRAKTQEKNGVTVTVSVLTQDETRAAFGKQIDQARIQPVWISIDNQSGKPYWLMYYGMDPAYFSAREASSLLQKGSMATETDIDRYFDSMTIDAVVPTVGQTSGFLFGNLKKGTKEVRVRLMTEAEVLEFVFYVTVPGLRADWQRTDFDSLYPATEIRDFDDPRELAQVIENFICCTTKADGTGSGDPINMVVITESFDSLLAFIKAGWDETEVITAGSSWRTAKAFFSSGEYKYSPISALYVFQRPQDISLQKARNTINERNHLRLWLTPWRLHGKEVYLGGISRDIGVFWTTRTWNLTSHAIDSEIDEARNYILEDLATAQSLKGYGYLRGVGETTREQPKQNLLGTPWWTDGLRVVLMLSDTPVPLEEMEVLDWTHKLSD
jgi:hypothetical protein